MSSPIAIILNLLRDPEVDKKVILKFALAQVKAIGYAKVAAMLLGLIMVGASSVIKIPQIRKILKPKTAEKKAILAEGLSKDSVRLETLAQFIHVTYNKQQGNSFINFGESFLLGLQNIALLSILEYYKLRKQLLESSTLSDKDQIQEALKASIKPVAAIIGSVLFITKVAPRSLIAALQVLIIPIGIAAKLPQIQRNAQLRSTAHLSEVTIGANVIGSLIRVYTTITNFKRGRSRDSVLLAGYLTSFVLNAVLAGQIYKYKKVKEE